MGGPADSPGDARPRDAVDLGSLREVFLAEAEDLLSAIGERLDRLRSDPGDADALAEIAAHGHALKGSAAMADMPSLSRAGALLQRAAELTSEIAERSRALELVRASENALAHARSMLLPEAAPDECERLLAEAQASFAPEIRSRLERDPDEHLPAEGDEASD